MAQQKFPSAGSYSDDYPNLLRNILNTIQIIMKGKTNNTGEVTLAAGVALTDVTLSKGDLSPTTVVSFMPTTANAAAEVGAGTMYVSSVNAAAVSSSGIAAYSYRIVHANNAQTDRIFKFLLIG